MKKLLAVATIGFVAACLVGALAIYRAQAKQQPIAYDHQKHVDAGMDCAQCHTGIAEKKARAGIPNLDICITCHGQDENPNTKAIRDYAAKGQLIPWRQVHEVPAHVYFSHQRHVGLAGLDCALCHGDMTKQSKPLTRPLIAISMTRCIDCHKKKGVTTDCLACHR